MRQAMIHKIKNLGSPYFRLMRLHQPTGIFLLLFPCLWGLGLGSSELSLEEFLQLFCVFTCGAVIMRSSGCIINDIIDRKIDAQVERTKTRPLASGELKLWQALILLVFLLAAGLALLLMLDFLAVLIGIFSLVLVITYPFMKRVTYWPQIFLGLTFNIGALMAWAAANDEITPPAILIYLAGIFWTLGYDTIYAHQDKRDDEAVGVKSTALRLKENTKFFVSLFYAAAILLLFIAGHFAGFRTAYNLGLVVALLQLLWQINNINLDDPADCAKRFRSNALFGLIVFLGIIAEIAFRALVFYYYN